MTGVRDFKKINVSVDFRVASLIATLLVLIKTSEPYGLVRTAVLKRFDAYRTMADRFVHFCCTKCAAFLKRPGERSDRLRQNRVA